AAPHGTDSVWHHSEYLCVYSGQRIEIVEPLHAKDQRRVPKDPSPTATPTTKHTGHDNATQAGYSSPQPSQERSSTTTGSNTTSSSPQHSASTAYQSDSYASEPKAETKPKPSKKQKANSTGQ